MENVEYLRKYHKDVQIMTDSYKEINEIPDEWTVLGFEEQTNYKVQTMFGRLNSICQHALFHRKKFYLGILLETVVVNRFQCGFGIASRPGNDDPLSFVGADKDLVCVIFLVITGSV